MKLLLTLLVTWSISSLTFSETTVTILADQSYAPYSYLENGVLKGAYIDIIKAASAELDEYQIELKAAKWSKALEQVEQGEVLALVPPYYKPKLRPFIHPYSVAIITEKLVIVADKNKITDSMTWPQSFSGWTIGRNSGFAFGKEIEESGQVTFAEAPKMATNLIRLAKGKIDGYANDELSIFYTLKKIIKAGMYPPTGIVIKTATTVSEETGHIGYSKAFEAEWKDDFILKMDEALKKIIESDQFEQILEKYK